jgi:thioredoxin 1
MQILTDATFDRVMTGTWLVMFSAPWAGPCNLVRPAFLEAAGRFGNTISFAEFNLDDNPESPEKYGVRQIPLFMVFMDGKPKKIVAGAVPFETLLKICTDVEDMQ